MRDRPNDTHRKVAAAAAGRTLKANEVVHHKDEDKRNNTPGNLRIMQRSEHSKAHAKERPVSKLRTALRSFREGRKVY